MGVICCCCRKEEIGANNNNVKQEEEKKKPEEHNILENVNSISKPNTNKSTEIETLGNNIGKDELLPMKEIRSKSSSKMERNQNNNIIEMISQREDFFVKIWIETLEISYKLCDDFGNFFKPFVEVIFDKQSKILNTMDEEKLNLSNISENADVNISYNANIQKKSGINSAILPKERFYYFKSSVDFSGSEENQCSSLIFSVKNENTHGHLKILPAITIGQVRIPISVLLHQKDKSFDGYLTLKLKEVIDIGQLKVKIQCGENFLNNSISLFNSDGFNQMGNFNLIRGGSELEDVNHLNYNRTQWT